LLFCYDSDSTYIDRRGKRFSLVRIGCA
jgi:hypothetical protein